MYAIYNNVLAELDIVHTDEESLHLTSFLLGVCNNYTNDVVARRYEVRIYEYTMF